MVKIGNQRGVELETPKGAVILSTTRNPGKPLVQPNRVVLACQDCFAALKAYPFSDKFAKFGRSVKQFSSKLSNQAGMALNKVLDKIADADVDYDHYPSEFRKEMERAEINRLQPSKDVSKSSIVEPQKTLTPKIALKSPASKKPDLDTIDEESDKSLVEQSVSRREYSRSETQEKFEVEELIEHSESDKKVKSEFKPKKAAISLSIDPELLNVEAPKEIKKSKFQQVKEKIKNLSTVQKLCIGAGVIFCTTLLIPGVNLALVGMLGIVCSITIVTYAAFKYLGLLDQEGVRVKRVVHEKGPEDITKVVRVFKDKSSKVKPIAAATLSSGGMAAAGALSTNVTTAVPLAKVVAFPITSVAPPVGTGALASIPVAALTAIAVTSGAGIVGLTALAAYKGHLDDQREDDIEKVTIKRERNLKVDHIFGLVEKVEINRDGTVKKKMKTPNHEKLISDEAV